MHSQSRLAARCPKRPYRDPAAAVAWQAALPAEWRAAAVAPLDFAVHREHEMMAAPVPEPETYAMLMAGLAALGAVTRRRKQASR